jgi:hypothetical protein
MSIKNMCSGLYCCHIAIRHQSRSGFAQWLERALPCPLHLFAPLGERASEKENATCFGSWQSYVRMTLCKKEETRGRCVVGEMEGSLKKCLFLVNPNGYNYTSIAHFIGLCLRSCGRQSRPPRIHSPKTTLE